MEQPLFKHLIFTPRIIHELGPWLLCDMMEENEIIPYCHCVYNTDTKIKDLHIDYNLACKVFLKHCKELVEDEAIEEDSPFI